MSVNHIIDLTVVMLLVLFFYQGWSKGFFLTLIGPISLVIGGIIAWVYYLTSQNLFVAIVIGLAGPFALKLIMGIAVRIWHKTFHKDKSLCLLSCVSGGCLNALWSGALIVLTVLLIVIAPTQFPGIQKIQKEIMRSQTYSVLKFFMGDKLLASNDIGKITNLFQDPKKLKKLESTREYKSLMDEPKIQDLFSEEETARQIRDKNVTQLLGNPKIHAILQDKELLKKIFALNKEMMELNTER